jgi:hypothetical protein
MTLNTSFITTKIMQSLRRSGLIVVYSIFSLIYSKTIEKTICYDKNSMKETRILIITVTEILALG